MKNGSWRTAAAAALVLWGCASTGPTMQSSDSALVDGAKVEITAEGGFAALLTTHRVDHDTREFSYAMRRICGTSCGAPSDTASGTLSAASVDSLFDVVLVELRSLPKDDYGITRNGADMMTYTIRVTSDGHVRTIHGDDGTIPEPARRIMEAVREAISAGREK
jgi:hypothetical protein